MDEHTAFEQAYKNGYEQGLIGLPNFGEVVYRKNMEKLGNGIYQEIVKVGITVDKDKIVKALTDARAFYKEGYEKGLKDAVKHGRWISVEEGLPEKEADVLMLFENNMAVGFWHDGDECVTFWCAYTDEGFYTDCDAEPTHWMPLPEPPKGE